MTIRRYHDRAFRDFQNAALAEKGGEYQVEILGNARDLCGAEFVSWMEEEIRKTLSPDAAVESIFDGERDMRIPDQPRKFEQGDFKQLTSTTANILWDAWKDENPGMLCSPSVWGYITSRFIMAERIKPSWLMSSNSSQSTGEAEIAKALGETGEKRNKVIDGCVRAFLRRLSGIHERGTRSLYQDCPIALTWWQRYIADEVSRDIRIDRGEVFELIRSPNLWVLLTDKMASKLTVIGDRNVRGGLIMFLLELGEKDAKKHLDSLIKHIGVMSGWRALGFFDPAEMRDIIDEEIYPLINKEEGNKQ